MDKTKLQELKKKIDQATVVSFDLYDTLVFRKTRLPQDIYAFVEFYTGFPDFSAGRERMQRKVARYVQQKYGYPHPSMHEIYKFWSRSNRKVLQVEKIERKLEECLAVRNPAMHEVLRYARACGKRIIITSDMYMERFQIEKILRRCSITEWDAVYVSSEIRKTKYDGTIYDDLIEKENVAADKILHIGDDRHADVWMAGRKGIRTFWYQDREADLAKSLHGGSCAQGWELSGKEAGFWYNLGYQIGGPLYLGLGLWLKETVKDKKLCCLSRDEYNLTRLLPKLGISDSAYILASRRALLLPHITKIGKKELELLPPYSCGQTVGEILSYIGLEEIPETEIRKAGLDGYNAVIRNKGDIARCKQLYQKNEKYVLKACRRERDNLKRYFASKDLFQKEVCFFDSGWNGTSQYLLQKIYQSLQKKCRIQFYYAGIKNARSKGLLEGYCYQSYFDGYMKHWTINRMLASSAVPELFFSEDAPAVKRYGESGVQFDAYERREYIRWINQGIEDYLSQKEIPKTTLSIEAVKRFGIYNLANLVLSPDSREAECIGNLENADRLSAAGGMRKYIARIPEKTLKANPFLDIYWEQGVYRHPCNTRYVKAFVWLRQRGAPVYRAAKELLKLL